MAGGPPVGAPGGGGGDVMEAAMRAQAYANQLAVAAGMIPGYPGMSGMSGMGGYPSGGGSDKPGERPSVMTLASTTGNSRICNFYQTDRGCAKSEKCDFIHQGPSDGGAAAAGGYGAAGYDAAGYAAAAGFGGFFGDGSAANFGLPSTTGSGSGKVCTFYGTARGCRKGSKCDFVHPATSGSSKSSVRYSPY